MVIVEQRFGPEAESIVGDDAQRDFTDRAIRELLSRPDNLRDLLEEAVPELASGFAVERMEPAPLEYFLGNWRKRTADLLFEIPYRTGAEESPSLVCVLLEHQTRSDWQVPLKTFIYAALYWEWQWRKWEEAKPPKTAFAITPILPIVLHTGSRPWGSARGLRELLAPPAPFHEFTPDWKPLFWELAAHRPEELLNGKAAFLQALCILKADESDFTEAERLFADVVRQLESLHDSSRIRWRDLLTFLLGWAHNKRPATERTNWHALAVQLQTTAERQREIENMGITIAQSIYQEGRQEGRNEGLLQQAHRTLLRLGRKRLGVADDVICQAVEHVVDLERLERMIDRAHEATSWVDLLTTG